MELWTKLPTWVRYPISFGLILLGVVIFFFTNPVHLTLVGTLIGLGVISMLIGPSDSEKKGYKF